MKVFLNNPLCIAICTLQNGRLVEVNEVFLKSLGCQMQDVIGRTFEELWIFVDYSQWDTLLRDIQKNGFATNRVLMFKDRRGQIRCGLFSVEPINLQGTRYLLTTIDDITERQLPERTLRESEEKYRVLVENSPEGIAISHEEHFIYANKAILNIFGYDTMDEFLQIGILDLAAPESREMLCSNLERRRQGDMSLFRYECRMARKNGEFCDLEVTSTPVVIERQLLIQNTVRDITQRKQAEESLASEKRFTEALFNILPGCTSVVDENGRFVRWNNNFEKLLGWSEDDMRRINFFDTIAPWDRNRVGLTLQDISMGCQAAMELTRQTKDGREIPFLGSAIRIEIDGKTCFVGVSLDISDRLRTEEALRESEDKYRTLVESSLEGIGISRNNKLIYANPALLNIFGYDTLDDFQQIPLLEHVAPESRDMIGLLMEKRHKGDKSLFQFEYKIIRKNGEMRDLEIASAHVDIGGEPYIQSTFRDITERKRAEKQIQESQAQLTHIINASPTAICVLIDRKFRRVNRAICELFGYTEQELLGQETRILYLSDEEYLRLGQEIHSEIQNSVICTREVTLVHKDGRLMTLKLTGIAMNPKDMGHGYLFNLVDVTAYKHAEKRLLDYQYQLREMSSRLTVTQEQERKEIATHLHDEIGQTLVASKMQLNMVLAEIGESNAQKVLGQINSNIGTMIDQVRNLTFDLTNPILYQLGLEAAIRDYLEQTVKGQLGFSTEMTADYTDKALSDEIKIVLFRIIRELLANAVKHSRAKKICVDIRWKADKINVEIRDDGVGFDVDAIRQSRYRKGLGLFSIQQQMEYYHGNMDIISMINQGTTVKISIPVAET